MKRLRAMLRGGGAAAALWLLASPAAGQESPAAAQEPGAAASPLTLDAAYAVARAQNPRLDAMSAMVDATSARESSARLPPDPRVELGVMNVSLPGLEADMPASMAPSIQAMQMVPFPGKLGLSGRIAEQSTGMARAAAEEEWWEIRSMVAMVFFELYETDRGLEIMRETVALLSDFRDVAQSMYAAGTGRQSDVLRANVEVARMDAEIERMMAMRRVAEARLNSLLGRPAETPVPEVVLPALPSATPDPTTLEAWSEASRPLVLRSRLGVDQARTREELARREIWPDLSIGLQYGRQNTGMGGEHMGGAMVGFSVPIFAGSRQLRMRDEAAAMGVAATAELEAVRADVDARIAGLLAELDRARTLVAMYGTEVLPQAAANVESSFASYRVGSVDFMTLLDARMALNRYEQEYHELLADYGRAVAELETTVGRELPASAGRITEDR